MARHWDWKLNNWLRPYLAIFVGATMLFLALSYGDTAQAKSYLWTVKKFNGPECMVFDTHSKTPSIITTSYTRDVLVRISLNGSMKILAGTGRRGGFNGDNLSPRKTRLNSLVGCALTPAGEIVFADSRNNRIRKLSADGKKLTTIAGSGPGRAQASCDPKAFSGDNGQARKARLNDPRGVALTPSGEVIFTERGNSRVRKIAPDGVITTIAGSGVCPVSTGPGEEFPKNVFNGEVRPARGINLATPTGVAVRPDGRILIADRGNDRVRELSADGTTVRTVIGPKAGAGIFRVPWNDPRSIELGPNGSIIIAQNNEYRVDVLTATGKLSTIVGKPGTGLVDNNNPKYNQLRPASRGIIGAPVGVFPTVDGGVLVSDHTGNAVRFVGPPKSDHLLADRVKFVTTKRKSGNPQPRLALNRTLKQISKAALDGRIDTLKKLALVRNGKWLSDPLQAVPTQSPVQTRELLMTIAFRANLALRSTGK